MPFSSPRITRLGLLIRVYCVRHLLGGWVCLAPLRGKSACPRFSNAESKRLLPGRAGHVPLFFSSICYAAVFSCESTAVRLVCHVCLEEESAIDSRTMEAVCTCGALWGILAPAVRFLRPGSARQKMAFPPGCRPRVARTEERHRRLPCIGVCLRFYRSRIGSENLHCGLAVVFVVYILPVERAACHIGFAHTGLLCEVSALRLGVLCPLHGKSAWLRGVHDCRAKRLLPGPDGHVPLHFPLDLLRGGFPVQNLPPCGMSWPCGWACCRRPIYETGVHLAGRCGAFGTLSARSELRLIPPPKMTFPPGCRSRVARAAERLRRLLSTGSCLRCYLSRIG